MNFLSPFVRQRYEFPCTIEIENTRESLHAHVEIEGDFVIAPGDQVRVIDAPEHPPFGEKIVVRRRAIVTRAGALERFWTRLAGNLELNELYDVSFTERRSL
jgi:hypothetical protein